MKKKALFFESENKTKIKCNLCPHYCIIPQNKSGLCNVRTNIGGTLVAENYGKISALHSDPVEKKPLYHFFPGKQILSAGSFGCNLKCVFCQNYEISQINTSDFENVSETLPELIIEKAVSTKNNIGIAYTYNEPTVFYEFMLETAALAREKKLKNVIVSNGFINKKPLDNLLNYADAFNIDIKSFSEEFYLKYTKSSLKPVLKTVEKIVEAKKHLEITFLLIPELNDNLSEFEKMLEYLSKAVGETAILHISAYFPNYRLQIPPTKQTLLNKFYDTAKNYLKYVYTGNVISDKTQNTYCPVCSELLIKRQAYRTEICGIINNKCKKCGSKIQNIILE